ncbi:MAG: hypothetical protein JSU96_11690 [Acidobacteriota bacterium]|nr:MAG: hypothetical protein JSU96_11690 [Acidobacteriota bacterium]
MTMNSPRGLRSFFTTLLTALFITTPVLAEKYKVSVDSAALTAEGASDFLNAFKGSVEKIKAKNSKGKQRSTVELEVRGDRSAANLVWGICKGEGIFIRRMGPPYGALALVLSGSGETLSSKEVRQQAVACMEERVRDISRTPEIKVDDTELFREGEEIGFLYVIRFDPGSWRGTYGDAPRKIGD